MEKRITSKDVAKRAGVSQATVSYVLNRTPNQSISEETRQKVLQAVEDLNYYPDKSARRFRSRRTNCITVVMEKELDHPRYAETLQIIREELESHGYRLLLSRPQLAAEGEQLPDHLKDYMENLVDGVLYVSADGESPDAFTLQAVKEHGIPFVAMDACVEDPNIATVDLDYGYGMQLALERLMGIGCSKILYFCPDRENVQERQRLEMLNLLSVQMNIPVTIQTVPVLHSDSLWDWTGQALDAVSSDTGVIISWQFHVSLVLAVLLMKQKKAHVASLTTASPYSQVYEDLYQRQTGASVFHQGLPLQEAGRTGVQALLRLIENPEDRIKVIYRPL